MGQEQSLDAGIGRIRRREGGHGEAAGFPGWAGGDVDGQRVGANVIGAVVPHHQQVVPAGLVEGVQGNILRRGARLLTGVCHTGRIRHARCIGHTGRVGHARDVQQPSRPIQLPGIRHAREVGDASRKLTALALQAAEEIEVVVANQPIEGSGDGRVARADRDTVPVHVPVVADGKGVDARIDDRGGLPVVVSTGASG